MLRDHTPYDLFTPDCPAEMIVALRKDHPGFLYSTSGGGAQAEMGRGMPSPALIEADDYVLIHGNGLRPDGVEAAIKAIRAMPAWQANPKPIVVWRALARGGQPGRPGGTAVRGARPTRALRARPMIPGCPTRRARAGTRGRLRR